MYFSGIMSTPNRLDICMHSLAPGLRRGVFVIPVFSAFIFGSGSALTAASSATGSNKGVEAKLEKIDAPLVDPILLEMS